MPSRGPSRPAWPASDRRGGAAEACAPRRFPSWGTRSTTSPPRAPAATGWLRSRPARRRGRTWSRPVPTCSSPISATPRRSFLCSESVASEVPLDLPGVHDGDVLVPGRFLRLDEPLVDVVAERVAHDAVPLHRLDRLVEVAGKIVDP